MTFYDIYEEFNHDNKLDLFELDEEIEKYDLLPIVINYRNLYNNILFCIIYSIKHFYIGKCKFKNQLMENNLMSSPYIDIPLQAYLDNQSNNIQELFKNYIYIDLNTICNESQCFIEDDRRIQFYVKKYEILEMPYILSINADASNYNENYNENTQIA